MSEVIQKKAVKFIHQNRLHLWLQWVFYCS